MGTEIRTAPALGHRPALDGVRALAVLLVAGVHTRPRLVRGGSIGVDVFFVLSGFLITTLLMEERDAGRIQFGRFYARRALRLLPALLALVAAVTLWAVAVADPGTRRDALHEVLAAITYTRNLPVWDGTPGTLLGHTWSLAVEEQFYLVWPLLLTVLVRPRGRALRWAVVFVVVGGVLGALRVAGVVGPGLVLAQRPEALLMGAALALVRRERWAAVAAYVDDRAAGALVMMGGLGLVAVGLWDGADAIDSVGFTVAAVLTVVLLAGLLLAGDGAAAAAFRHPAARWLGRRSYGFYLWHMPVLRWTDDRLLGRSAWLRIPLGLGLAMVATVLSYRYVETPALRWKERFRPAHRASPAPAHGRTGP